MLVVEEVEVEAADVEFGCLRIGQTKAHPTSLDFLSTPAKRKKCQTLTSLGGKANRKSSFTDTTKSEIALRLDGDSHVTGDALKRFLVPACSKKDSIFLMAWMTGF